MRRPTIKSPCVADAASAHNERIAEFNIYGHGGLISLRLSPEGKPIIELYRLDEAVQVIIPKED